MVAKPHQHNSAKAGCAEYVKRKKAKKMTKCCKPVYWKHDEGWDVYRQSSFSWINSRWIPDWFDDFIIEDAPTKKNAIEQFAGFHVLGICLV